MEATESVQALLAHSYTLLRLPDLEGARKGFEKALSVDYEDQEVLFALRCAHWWEESLEKTAGSRTGFELGEYFISQWKAFHSYLRKSCPGSERAQYAFKQYAFRMALEQYEKMSEQVQDHADPELLLRIGRSLKGSGDFEKAMKALEEASKIRKDDAAILADLADTYALVDEERSSKALFREAFFLNPQRIDLDLIESGAVMRLAEHVRGTGKTGPDVCEWIPVYGNLLGVFSVKRELRPIEAGKLKQSIFELEQELSGSAERRHILVPKLLNRYFWLIEHFVAVKEEKSRIDEVLLKIKLLDISVYKQFVA